MTSPVTIITVAYNSAEILGQMRASLPEGAPLIVVDNASDDAEATRAAAGDAMLIHNEQNQGFGRACNQGAAAAETEFLLFLNPDTILAPGSLDALVASARAHPQASGWNPRFLDGNGQERLKARTKLAPEERITEPLPEADCVIPTLHGSAIFVARTRFEGIGGFDPAIFLYHEDDDLSIRLQKHGPLMRCHAAVVTHLEGRSSPRTPETAYFKAYHMARSRVYAYAKHGNRSAAQQTLSQGLLGLLSPLNIVSKRKRQKALGFLKGTLSARKDGGAFRGS